MVCVCVHMYTPPIPGLSVCSKLKLCENDELDFVYGNSNLRFDTPEEGFAETEDQDMYNFTTNKINGSVHRDLYVHKLSLALRNRGDLR